ncbi:MAG: glycosyltransferase family 1 protein [Chloroflexi bacterium]|nr:glycosyltransferase family 1 protein [Chloroflexota bacterium]
MRIAMLSVHTCPLATLGGKDTGGMNVYVRDLTRELGRRGIGVDVFTRSQDEHQPHVKHDLGYGNRVVHIPAGPEMPLAKTEIYDYLHEFVGGVREFAALEDLHYDVIHSHYWLSGVVAHELQKFWRAPIVHMAHTLAVMKNRIAQRPEEREPALRVDSEWRILDWADTIIAATLAEKSQLELLMQADSRKIEVIPPGVDLAEFHPIPMAEAKMGIGVPPEDTMLLFVGRIEPLKGVDTLLRAMKLLRDRGGMPPHLCLSIIGGDPSHTAAQDNAEMERLRALRQELGIGDVVAFLGKRDQDALNNYYASAQAVIMPSHYESFGLVALEAMACGTPVIASEVGGLAFLVRDGETGFTVPDRDPEALCDKLQMLIGDHALRAKLGAQAAEYARGYAWTLIADRIVEVYESLVVK